MKLLLSLLFSLISLYAFAARSVTLAWDRNPEPDVSGYVVYYGNFSRFDTNNPNPSEPYPWHTNTSNVTTWTVYDITKGTNWFFALTATNLAGLESDFSNEVMLADPLIRPPTNLLVWTGLQTADFPEGPWTDLWTTKMPVDVLTNKFYRAKVQMTNEP